jgi:hypothetical protein
MSDYTNPDISSSSTLATVLAYDAGREESRKEIAALRARCEAYKEALENIVKHQKLIVPDLYRRTAPFNIAQDALAAAKEEEKP